MSLYGILYIYNIAQKIKFSIKKLSVNVTKSAVSFTEEILDPIQDGRFWCCSRIGQSPFQKSVTYLTMLKHGSVIPYLKGIQKINESRGTPSEFC